MSKRNRERRSVTIEKWGKPLLIFSAVTSLSIPSVHVALADNGSLSQSSSSGSTAPSGTTSQPPSSSTGSSAAPATGTSSTPSSAVSSTETESTTSSAAPKSTASSAPAVTPSAAASAQNNKQPSQSNAVTEKVSSQVKTVSAKTVAKASVKRVQSTQANYTKVQTQASGSATNSTTSEFIAEIGAQAQRIAAANNLYASVMIAQAILESASGQSGLTLDANNLFGIKGSYNGAYVTMWTSEDDGNGKMTEVLAEFRKYPSLSASLQDYASLLKNGVTWNHKYYANVWRSNAATYQDAARALQGTYATDTGYASSLDQLISQYDLTRYDSGKAVAASSPSVQLSTSSAAGTVGSTVSTNGILYVSSDASSSVNTYLSKVTISKIYPGARNKYQVSNNGVVVGYLRTLPGASTSGSTSTVASRSSSSAVGSTVSTNGILYVSSDASNSVKTYLSKVTISKIYPGARNKYQVSNNGAVVGYLRMLPGATSGSTSTIASQPSSSAVGSTVSTNGILYVSSDAASSVNTYLSKVTISKIYPAARNKYQVSSNGTVVGYLRTLTGSGSATGSASAPSTKTQSASGSISVGTTVATNDILYLSSTSVAPLITSLTKVQVSQIFPSALNKYQVEINGVVVGYLRFATAVSTVSNPAASEIHVGTTLNTNGKLYVSSTDAPEVMTSLKSAKVSKIFPSALNKYQVAVNGIVVGYLR